MTATLSLSVETMIQRTPLEGRLVMVLDDESSQVESIRRSLRRTGCRVIGSVDPMDFLELLEANYPDLIILDVMMPGMDGWEVFRRLREMPGFQLTPVVFLTALARVDEEYQFTPGAGHCRLLAKPVSVDRLVSAMEELLSMSVPFRGGLSGDRPRIVE